ncbi:hypothetical protein ABZ639_28540 [Saccharomonospora sp. NPDC006951]
MLAVLVALLPLEEPEEDELPDEDDEDDEDAEDEVDEVDDEFALEPESDEELSLLAEPPLSPLEEPDAAEDFDLVSERESLR